MFTGLIRELATVSSYHNETLTLKSDYKPGIGDSIAINGACLTVTKVHPPYFEVELSKESRDLLAMENYQGKVHMEPAMQFGDRIEGHMVQGHIDCIGTVSKITKSENAWDVYIDIPAKYIAYMMPKGSIAIDGISLTINDIQNNTVRLTIIKHTMKETLFSDYKVGRRINIETDMFARYIYNMLQNQKVDKKPSWEDIERQHARY
jgi:riboflavin synthase